MILEKRTNYNKGLHSDRNSFKLKMQFSISLKNPFLRLRHFKKLNRMQYKY